MRVIHNITNSHQLKDSSRWSQPASLIGIDHSRLNPLMAMVPILILLTPILFQSKPSYGLESAIGLYAQDTGSHTDPNVTIQSPSGGGMAVGIHTLIGFNLGSDSTYNVTLAAKEGTSTSLEPLNTNGSSGSGTSSASVIPTTTGTLASPKVLNTNEWGFAIPDMSGSKFSPSANYNSTDQKVLATTTWAGITDSTNPVSIINREVKAGELLNENVYYGARTAQLTKANNYRTTITYTLTATIVTPIINSITPNTYQLGTTDTNASKITITGSNLQTTKAVYIDLNSNSQKDTGEDCTSLQVVSNTEVTCSIPTGGVKAGNYDLHLLTEGGDATDKFSYIEPIDPPVITKIDPAVHALQTGDTAESSITVTGKKLGGVSKAFIDLNENGRDDAGEECQQPTNTSDTSFSCLIPVNVTTSGVYDFYAVVSAGSVKKADGFSYILPIYPGMSSTGYSYPGEGDYWVINDEKVWFWASGNEGGKEGEIPVHTSNKKTVNIWNTLDIVVYKSDGDVFRCTDLPDGRLIKGKALSKMSSVSNPQYSIGCYSSADFDTKTQFQGAKMIVMGDYGAIVMNGV